MDGEKKKVRSLASHYHRPCNRNCRSRRSSRLDGCWDRKLIKRFFQVWYRRGRFIIRIECNKKKIQNKNNNNKINKQIKNNIINLYIYIHKQKWLSPPLCTYITYLRVVVYLYITI